MKRFRLTTMSKILIMILIVAIVGGGVACGLKKGFITTKNKKKENITLDYDENGNVMNTDKTKSDAINLSLDEWIGWSPILIAKDTGIFDDLGIEVNISVINDATQSSNALIKGSLDAAGYTINRTAFLSQKFKTAGVDVIMPYITNYSNGGDGIIATDEIKSVGDLVNAKIGVPQFSEAHTLVLWFVKQSDLSDDDKQKIIDNLLFFETPDEAAKAFFAGEVDVAATWEPYLTQAQNMTDAHIFFSTASSSSLVMDGIVFNKKFADKNPEVVQKFIQGCLKASRLYESNFNGLKRMMPMFSTMSDEDILENTKSAKLATWSDNKKLLNGTAKTIYANMCDIWNSVGEETDGTLVNTLFDDSYITAIESNFDASETSMNTDVKVENEQDAIDTEALLKKSTSVEFKKNTSKFFDGKQANIDLKDFLEIASVLDGSIIVIEGNCGQSNPSEWNEQNEQNALALSKSRAETIKNYFVMNGISADRIVCVGNGSKKPLYPNDTDEHKQANRRTDISFKILE